MPDLELIRACAESNDSAAWEEFLSRFHRVISVSVIRAARQWADAPLRIADDLVQETYLKLCSDRCRRLCDFALQHPDAIVGYIRTIATNVTHDHFKAIHSKKRGTGQPHESLENITASTTNEDTGSPAAMERRILLQQIDLCLATCSPESHLKRDRLIFWLYYRQGMSAQTIAALPTVGLTAKGVESLILRLTRLVRQQIAQSRSEALFDQHSGKKGFRPAESF